jgi:hypothetical protein
VQNVWGPTWLKYRTVIRGKTALMMATVRQLVTVPSRYSRKKPVWYDVPVGNTVELVMMSTLRYMIVVN